MAKNDTRELVILGKASRMLAEARSLDEVTNVRDKAEAARAYAKKARLGLELQNQAAELKLRAERKAGVFLGRLRLAGGNRKSKSHDAILKLDDLGITPDESSRWQKEAAVPNRDFQQYLKAARDLGEELTQAGLLRVATALQGVRRSRKKPKPRSPDGGRTIEVPPEPIAVIHELENHRGQLVNLLESLTSGKGVVEIERAAQMLVARILGEMEAFLTELERLWKEDKEAETERRASRLGDPSLPYALRAYRREG